jgi:hypothetical protein
MTGFSLVAEIRSGEFSGDPANAIVGSLLGLLITPIFAFLGALIISKQPRNTIGWLLAVPALINAVAALLGVWTRTFETAPESVPFGLFVALWLDSWSWLLFIFPIFHLLQVFPTGRVLTPRWRWLAYLEAVMIATFLLLGTFSSQYEAYQGDIAIWSVENPIGFISAEFWNGLFSSIWSAGLLVLVLGGGASTIVRFRRARAAERQQLKWLLSALVVFAIVYAITVAFVDSDAPSPVALDALFLLSVISIPVVMTMSVLRYRLFDIDLIIRKTVQYGLLTGLLAAVYFGSVVALQSLFRGERNSSITVAASTLLITASFSPLRRRIQTLIDRRLFRSKYNAQQVIEKFGGAAQNQANLETLSADLWSVVGETIQPRSGGLWIRDPVHPVRTSA